MSSKLFEAIYIDGQTKVIQCQDMVTACVAASQWRPDIKVASLEDVTEYADTDDLEDEEDIEEEVRFEIDKESGMTLMMCPWCDSTPHMIGTAFGPGIVEESVSGPGLIIESYCENSHHWNTIFCDNCGSVDLSVIKLPDVACP